MTRQQFTIVLILLTMAVLACGISAPVVTSAAATVDIAPPWYPVARYVEAVAVELQMDAEGKKVMP